MNDEAPEVWALTSYRAGETSQILALAAALGKPWKRVDVRYSRFSGLPGLLQMTSRAGTQTELRGPWPRLLISAGLGNEPIARWIRAMSGGHTRLVFLGRTWAGVSHFDLVVTTPQYRLRAAPNVIENPLTLHSVTAEKLQQAETLWSPRFSGHSELQIGVLIGGASGPYTFDEAFAARLADQLSALSAGSASRKVRFLVTSSSRTPAGFLTQLKTRLPENCDLYAWGDPGENPYFGILAWADLLVVTADSIAMISEAVATGKRVLLAQPSVAGSLRAAIYRSAIGWGHKRWTRDVGLVHERLAAMGLVEWLAGARLSAAAEKSAAEKRAAEKSAAEKSAAAENRTPAGYMSRTVAQVRQLLD